MLQEDYFQKADNKIDSDERNTVADFTIMYIKNKRKKIIIVSATVLVLVIIISLSFIDCYKRVSGYYEKCAICCGTKKNIKKRICILGIPFNFSSQYFVENKIFKEKLNYPHEHQWCSYISDIHITGFHFWQKFNETGNGRGPLNDFPEGQGELSFLLLLDMNFFSDLPIATRIKIHKGLLESEDEEQAERILDRYLTEYDLQ